MNNNLRNRVWRRTLPVFAVWFVLVMVLDAIDVNGLVQTVAFFGGLVIVGGVFQAALGTTNFRNADDAAADDSHSSDFHREMREASDHDHRYSPAYAPLPGNIFHEDYEREQDHLRDR